jgi:hypothetical protein
MMSSRLRKRKFLAVLAGLCLAILPGTAGVAQPNAVPNSICAVKDPAGHPGSAICEYGRTVVFWPDGHEQEFVIGTNNYAVYQSYELGNGDWSGWISLGGAARSGVYVDYLSSSEEIIRVLGTDYAWWCKYWFSFPTRGWTAWQHCEPTGPVVAAGISMT